MDIMRFFNLVKFIFALMQGNYVTVTEFSRFFNFLCGTHTNTVSRINKMLCKADYQVTTQDLSQLDDEVTYIEYGCDDMYYISTPKGLKWRKIAIKEIAENGQLKNIRYLQWNPQILFEIFNFTFDDDVNDISKKIIDTVKEYDLINSKREIIDKNILQTNISILKNILELVQN